MATEWEWKEARPRKDQLSRELKSKPLPPLVPVDDIRWAPQ